ncbi:MAG: TonB-dependent receptor [Sphingomicrobium sp.]
MVLRTRVRHSILAAVVACAPAFAGAQSRTDDNAITQAEDAFGFSIGRESLGIYNAGQARGFSPTAAGNLRIDGLYFDQVFGLPSTLIDSANIKVGLSAQGYPFAAPSGIVDYSFHRPESEPGASVVFNFDSHGTAGLELSGSLPISSKLSLGFGLNGTHVEFPDGTNNDNHTESLSLRWQPASGIEIMPFWSRNDDYHDEAGTFYVPAGAFLPKLPKPGVNEGAKWADYQYTGTNFGVLASARLASNTVVRLGAFRSVNDQQHAFSNLLVDEQPDGTGDRILYADPRSIAASTSGELRLTQSIPDGPRLHVIHLSLRSRNARREFGGSELIDFGPGQIGQPVDAPEPDHYNFGEISHDRLRQTTIGVAYDGRWKNVGEISFGLSQANYRKDTFVPEVSVARARSKPLLYNATAAANLTRSITAYAGYARGLEETGTAPPNAANRNQPLPAILTEQKDAGIRFSLTKKISAVAGVFDLSRPYFGFDGNSVFKQIGTVRSRGAEFSVSGSITPKLNVVAGGVVLNPRVTATDSGDQSIGSKPVALPTHILISNFNWKTPVKGIELDLGLSHRGRVAARTDNALFLPARARVDIGGRYGFHIAKRSATFRLQLVNLFNNPGYGLAGSGVYTSNPGRFVQSYLAVDL